MDDASAATYDALMIVSFGGPERSEDVLPFLENVLRGKPVPHQRLLEVAEHYQRFGGRSPINQQNRTLISALRENFRAEGPALPIYLGNRNWHPLLSDTLAQMADLGVRRALAFFTSGFSSYSSCRQYRENIAEAQRAVGPRAPRVDKLRAFFNHPGFIAAAVSQVHEAINQLPGDRQADARLIYTAHSIPQSMAEGCQYEAQLAEACRLVSAALGRETWCLAYQSRSGSPLEPWLEPDIGDAIRQLCSHGARDVVVVPIGFFSDHMEVIYDLDTEARAVAEDMGLGFVRAATVGTHPLAIAMIRDLVLERLNPAAPRLSIGTLPPCADVCPDDCCLMSAKTR